MRKTTKSPGEKIVKDIKRATRKHYSSEEKIRIVLDGLRGEDSIAELCRREGISQGIYYKWSKDFMEAGKKRLAGDTARAANSDEVKELRREAKDLKEVVAEQTLELRLLKKHDRRWGRRRMRYPASEKLEIIRLVEESHLSARRTLAKLGIPRTTFYRWYDRYLQRGKAGLQDQSPKPKHVWNHVPTEVKRKVVNLALQETELSPRELAVTFTDQERYFVSESTVYRTLKAHDLITSPAFIVLKAANEFQHKTTAINQLWQTDFTYIKVLGWGWFYLSTVLDDYSRYIVSWKLCTTMRTEDVTDTLELALQASGCDQVHVVHKPRLLSDNGSSYVSGDLAEWLQDKGMKHSRGAPYHPQTQGKIERWHQTLKNRILLENYFLPGDLEAQIEAFVDHYNNQRYHESINNVTPADVYFGRDKAILKQRERIKRKTLEARRLHHRQHAA
ncbi:MAG: IS3 family transposase [Roseobacter sp.]|nr:IS3 family transposase [Roseobacter sp.]MDW3181144.1 IS3 family transposase [Roseobacter sp.]MDW3181476.1 IS3 family transposase [Roseobacter sp.]MDW3181517.1 IS3 family transposase [Roseobacter sp.]MDW3182111.1 IS3 family transposase [Roseobacter sp.]MDW3182653.1 IS3 family transposase [Roseobacter sp.]